MNFPCLHQTGAASSLAVRVMQEARVEILLCSEGLKEVPLDRLARVIILSREPDEIFSGYYPKRPR